MKLILRVKCLFNTKYQSVFVFLFFSKSIIFVVCSKFLPKGFPSADSGEGCFGCVYTTSADDGTKKSKWHWYQGSKTKISPRTVEKIVSSIIGIYSVDQTGSSHMPQKIGSVGRI